MHYFIIDALVQSYKLIPIGGAKIEADLLKVITTYVSDYFVIAIRVALPIFTCIFIINVILGVLAKVAPQMNMFAVGIQIKVLVGLSVMFLLARSLPTMADFLFSTMRMMVSQTIKGMM